MVGEYIQKALKKGKHETIEDKEPYYGEVEELSGVWATGKNLEECRRKLSEGSTQEAKRFRRKRRHSAGIDEVRIAPRIS